MVKKNEELYELKKKSPKKAVIMSAIFPGIGQIYSKKYGKGIFMFFLSSMLWIILMGWTVNIWSAIDAHGSTLEYNRIVELELGIK